MTFLQHYVQTFKDIAGNQPILTTLILSVLFYSFFYPTAYKAEQAQAIPIVIVDEEKSPLTAEIISQANRSPNIEIIRTTVDFLEAKRMIETQQADGILLLPSNLSQTLRHGEMGGIGLYLSTTNFLKTKQIGLGLASAIEQTLSEHTAQFTARTAFEFKMPIHQIPLFNTSSGYGSYIFPAVAPLMVHQTIFLGLCMLIATYREQKWQPTATQFWAIFTVMLTIGCLSSFYLYGFTFWAYDYPRGGNFLGMLLATPVFVSAIIGLGFVVASYLDSPERAGHVIVVTSIPLFLLTGAAWSHQAMPELMQWFAWVLPSTHGVQMFVQLNQMGASIAEVSPKIMYLIIFALVLNGLGYYRLIKQQK